MKKKIAIFYGTRPEYLKLRNIIKLIPPKKRDVYFIGQHKELIHKNYFEKKISINKSNNKNRLNSLISQITNKVNLHDYDSVIIQGDTATTFGVAVVAFNNRKKIIYVESGLRTFDFDNPFPEEGYRQMISRISDINLCPTILSMKNLISEKIRGKIFVSGNTSLDNLLIYKKNTKYDDLVLITLHRRENISQISNWFFELNKLAGKYKNIKFIFPIHKNSEIIKHKKILKNVKVIENLPHEKFMKIFIKSKLIITDSGGIQEEASFLNKKVIVCRKFTERPEGIKSGHLFICKNPRLLMNLFKKLNKNFKINNASPYGDGRASKKIVKFLSSQKIL